MIGVLALQGDVREHLRALGELGETASAVRRPEELDRVDALVIPGGESTTISKLAVEFGLLDPVRKRIADGMPAYGSCAGMIMLADRILDGRPDQQQFGGVDMVVRRNAFGRQVDSFEAGASSSRRSPSTRSSSGHHGSNRSARMSRCWGASRTGRPPVGLSRFGRALCSPPPSTQS